MSKKILLPACLLMLSIMMVVQKADANTTVETNRYLDEKPIKISVKGKIVQNFFNSIDFKSAKLSENLIDKNSIFKCVKSSHFTVYSLKLINSEDAFLIYESGEGRVTYAKAMSKYLENGQKYFSLTTLSNKEYFSFVLDENNKITNLVTIPYEQVRLNIANSKLTGTSYFVNEFLKCLNFAIADCNSSWSCQAMCAIIGQSSCLAMWATGCAAEYPPTLPTAAGGSSTGEEE